MKKLQLDFAAGGTRAVWIGRVLLAIALAVSVDTALSFWDTVSSLERNRDKIAMAAPRAAPARTLAAEEVAAVRDTVNRLGMPWDKLFGALEAAASEKVALVGIEPDPKAGTVTIVGDSKDYLAALSYVVNLERSGALERVQLVRHEAGGKDPERPVSFTVSAAWTEASTGAKP